MSGTFGFRRGGRAVRGAGAVVLLLSAAACGAEGGAGGEGGAVAENSYSEVVPAGSSSYTPTDFEGIAIDVPEDWAATTEGNRLCMTPKGQQDCGFGALQVFAHAAEKEGSKWPKKGGAWDKEGGWAPGGAECRAPGSEGKKVEKAALTTGKGALTEHADGLKSHHRVWQVSCEGGAAFEVRMWFLPTSDVLVYVPAADPAFGTVYDEVAVSMDVSAYNG